MTILIMPLKIPKLFFTDSGWPKYVLAQIAEFRGYKHILNFK